MTVNIQQSPVLLTHNINKTFANWHGQQYISSKFFQVVNINILLSPGLLMKIINYMYVLLPPLLTEKFKITIRFHIYTYL